MNRAQSEMEIGEAKSTALKACEYLMRPMAKLLLRMGVGYKEFAEAAKVAFVDVASSEYGIRGRPTNISRVAVMTGLTRKEVKKLRDLIAADDIEDAFRNRLGPCSVVMHFWHHDPDFQDVDGEPRPLPLDGAGLTFSTLVRKYGGDIPAGAMLKELIRTGVAEKLPDDTVRPLKEFVIPIGINPDKFVSVSFSLANLANTLAHNVSDVADQKPLFERFLWTDRLNSDNRDEFQKVAGARATEFLKSLDKWVAEREFPKAEHENQAAKRIGLGIYLFDTESTDNPFY